MESMIREKQTSIPRGISLAETLIGVVCGVMLAISIILILRAGVRIFRAEEGRSSSLQHVLLAYDRIQKDIRQSLYYPQLDQDTPVQVQEDGHKLELAIMDKVVAPKPPDFKPGIQTCTIHFSLEPSRREGVYFLARSENGRKKVFKSIMIRDLLFEKESFDSPGEEPVSILRMFIRVFSQEKDFDGLVFPFIFVLKSESYFLQDKHWQSGF